MRSSRASIISARHLIRASMPSSMCKHASTRTHIPFLSLSLSPNYPLPSCSIPPLLFSLPSLRAAASSCRPRALRFASPALFPNFPAPLRCSLLLQPWLCIPSVRANHHSSHPRAPRSPPTAAGGTRRRVELAPCVALHAQRPKQTRQQGDREKQARTRNGSKQRRQTP